VALLPCSCRVAVRTREKQPPPRKGNN